MVRIDEITGTLQVGPESAGAEPGPVCYGRGGEVPTVTDADLVLGRLNPDNFAGGAMRLDADAARRAIGTIADRLNLDVDACASGITQIVEFQMADLIHKATIQKGFDPRDFVLFAFGGAGPAHAGVFAAELGVAKVVIPQRATASVWCAFGAASVDLLHIYERVDIMASPLRPRPDQCSAGVAASAGRGPAPRRRPARGAPSVPLRARHAAQGPDPRGRGGARRGAGQTTRVRAPARAVHVALRTALRKRIRRSPGRGWRSSPRGAGRRRRRRIRRS